MSMIDNDIDALVCLALGYTNFAVASHESWKLFEIVVLGFCEAMRKP